ncbi:MAG TPA: hypothetical protein VNI54_01480 [Thermoanaerobaculia bacterium]|nr:hypothetical protein [Thermoanaerobaculia bacterium]
MTEQDDFLARLRADAAPLRHRPDKATLARIRERIHARIAAQEPTVADLIASWFRPLAAAVALVAIAAVAGLASLDVRVTSVDRVEIAVGGETYVVGD